MKILITGDKGFVGTETRKILEANNHEVVGFDLMTCHDIRDPAQFENAVKATMPDRILHLAAIARFADADKDPKVAYETNAHGTRNVAMIAQKYHIPVVYASTGSVYMPITERPPITENFKACGNSVYGCSKYVGETYIRSCNPHIILRYAHLYGKEKRGHGLVGGFIDRIQRGLEPKLYGGLQSNDFTYIKDVARANMIALTASWDKWNQIYNIGTGEALTAQDAGNIICKAFKYKGKIHKIDARSVDPLEFVYNCDKAISMLGFKAEYTFKQGLEDMEKEGLVVTPEV